MKSKSWDSAAFISTLNILQMHNNNSTERQKEKYMFAFIVGPDCCQKNQKKVSQKGIFGSRTEKISLAVQKMLFESKRFQYFLFSNPFWPINFFWYDFAHS